MEQQRQVRISTAEVVQRIRAELALPDNDLSPSAQQIRRLRERQDRFRADPIGGRLLVLKRVLYWFIASAFDRQGKVIDELLDVVEELGRENERLQEQLRDLTSRLPAAE